MQELTSASREELLEIIQSLLGRVQELEARVTQLEEENRRLRQGGGGMPLVVKPSRPRKEKQPRKPRLQAFVRRRETPDEVRYHAAECCPDCGRKLQGGWPHRRRQTIELVLQKKVVEHVLVGRWCGVCRKRVLPTSANAFHAQGQRRFGVSVQSLVAMLHIGGRLPLRMIRRMLREMFGLHISEGESVALLEGVKQAGEEALQEILQHVRGSPGVCGDERCRGTEDGCNGYLWGFFTPTERYFVYRQSRAGAIPVEVLGEEFAGVVTCDFYGGYNRLGLLQRCWVHLLRDAWELVELNADRPEVAAWVEALQALYREAKAFSHPQPRARRQARREFERQAAALAQPYAKEADAPQRVLAQRILKHRHELFVFVTDPEVPADNNLAERSLRPAVIARKISGGTRSPKGSDTKTALMSLFGTWAAQGKPLLASCQQLLLTPASAD